MATKREKKKRERVNIKPDAREKAKEWYKGDGIKWMFALISFILMYIIFYFNRDTGSEETGYLIDSLRQVALTLTSRI